MPKDMRTQKFIQISWNLGRIRRFMAVKPPAVFGNEQYYTRKFPFVKGFFGIFLIFLELCSADLDAGAHGGSDDAGTDILALCCSRLCLDDSGEQGAQVLIQLFRTEGNLADGAVNDVGLVETILDFTSFDLLDSSSDIGSHGAGLGRRHQALRAQEFAETADNAHHVRRSNDDIKVEPVFLGDSLDHIHAADIVSAGLFGLFSLGVLGKYQDSAGLAGAVGKNDRTADLLVSMTGVNAQSDVNFYSFIEFCFCGLADKGKSIFGFVLDRAVNFFRTVSIFFTSKQC